MYKIEKKNYGCKLTFGGFIQPGEMKQWLEESNNLVKTQGNDFKVLVDMRKLAPLPPESQKIMEQGQKMFRQNGMKRSAVILENAITKMQFRQIAKSSGIYNYERYISADEHADWEKRGENWIQDGIDPDK